MPEPADIPIDPMTCPSCAQPMTEQVLDGHLATSVAIDVCLTCQAFWFDGRESLQLTPGSTLRLFRIIGERAADARHAFPTTCKCPRCGMRLMPAHDLQRATKFEYQRCPAHHGRFIGFFDFLREKNFIKPLSPAQVEELRRNVQMVNCSNCGAPIDLAGTSTCAHCGSPLSMLDMKQAEILVAELRQAEAKEPGSPGASGRPGLLDPTLPLRLEQARREVAASFASFDQNPSWYEDVSTSGLVGAGLTAVLRWLK